MIILMGVAGAGKSMQGRLFADEHGFAWISTGELLRVLVTGRRRREMLDGRLLNDEEVIDTLDKVLQLIDLSEEFVLDGFPRTIHQAEWLLEQVKRNRFNINAVINLIAPQEIARKRLQSRGRQDDTELAIDLRFEEYEQVTEPILQLFKHAGLPVYDIDATDNPKEVHDAILMQVKMPDSAKSN